MAKFRLSASLGTPARPSRRLSTPGRATKNILAKIPRNPLKRLISDERIQGNPRKSNSLSEGFRGEIISHGLRQSCPRIGSAVVEVKARFLCRKFEPAVVEWKALPLCRRPTRSPRRSVECRSQLGLRSKTTTKWGRRPSGQKRCEPRPSGRGTNRAEGASSLPKADA